MGIAAFFYSRNKIDYYKSIFKRAAIIGGIGLFIHFIPSDTLIDIYYGDTPAYAELYKRVLSEPDNLKIKKELYMMRIELLKKEIDKDKY